jgi:hypothetical protein
VTSGFKNISAWGKQNVINKGSAASPNYYNRIDTTKEVLSCPACHDDGNGNSYSFKVRQIPAVTGYYNYSSQGVRTIFVSYSYPDIGRSNICMCCHTGREIGDSLKAGASAMNFANVKFINSHYLTAGATVFGKSGYNFNAYTPTLFQHDQIGLNNYLGTGSSGPCVGCHMSSSTKHLFLPVTRVDESNLWSDITGIASTKCLLCHSPQQWTPSTLQAKKDGYHAALDILKYLLGQRGYCFNKDKNPYFFTDTTWATPVTNWGNEKNMGAAFNLNLLYNDPGGFAHNSGYVRKLIYDSIDWIDGSTVNSVGVTIETYPDAIIKARAAAYLLR